MEEFFMAGIVEREKQKMHYTLNEISHMLPPNAEWRRAHLPGGYCQKKKEYTQVWTVAVGEPFCELCETPCKGENVEAPEFLEDLIWVAMKIIASELVIDSSIRSFFKLNGGFAQTTRLP